MGAGTLMGTAGRFFQSGSKVRIHNVILQKAPTPEDRSDLQSDGRGGRFVERFVPLSDMQASPCRRFYAGVIERPQTNMSRQVPLA